jgi:soluble lytic murein transglycosylase
MNLKRTLVGVLLITCLTGCSLGPALFGSAGTVTPSPIPSLTPTITATPTPSPTPTPLPQVRVENADQALFNGDYDHARNDYQIALESGGDPEVKAAALWGLGRVDYGSGNSAQALEDLRQLVIAYPTAKNATDAYFLLGEIYSSLGRYSEAVDAYNAYLTQRPGVIDYYVQARRGDAFAAAANYPQAITAYQAALAAAHIGDDTRLKIEIAQAYASAGDTVTALGMYDSIFNASASGSVKAQVDFLSGQIYFGQGKTDLEHAKYLDAVNNYPLSYDSYSALVALVNDNVPVDDLNRGLVDFNVSQYGYALDAFNRYIAANPQNDGTVHYYRALTLRELGNYQEAVDEITTFINNYSGNDHWESAWADKAYMLWVYLDQYDQAAQTLLDFAAADPSSTTVPAELLEAGRIYERANQLEDAAKTWEGIANTRPGSDVVPQALFWAGIAYYRLAKYDPALLDFQRDLVLSTAPEDQARAALWIGKTQQQKGDTTAAQAAWQQAAAADPTGYYSVRAGDLLFNRAVFTPAASYELNTDLATERAEAEAWVRVKFNLPADTDLSTPGALLTDPRLVRGTELWNLGLNNEAKAEFEDLRQSVSADPANSFRLANYLLDRGLYYPAIFAVRQVLTLAGMETTAQTLAAPIYFNHVRFGLYYQEIITSTAEQFGLQPMLLFSVMRQESLYESFIQSPYAVGLMQIVPSTGQDIAKNMTWPNYTDNDLTRPLVSIEFGAHYLLSNQMFLNGDLYATLAAYNGGPGFAQSWQQLAGSDPDLFLEIVRKSETQDYIRGVYENFAMYRLLYGKNQ